MKKKAILLINLGTPDQASPLSVRRYLKEFLNDPRVVDLASVWRWLLVNAIVLPLRYRKSSRAYQKIWTDLGSPLLVNTQRLSDQVSSVLGEDYHVEFAMRYGKPSIPTVLEKFQHADSLTVIPLFPQYSSAATGSAIEKVMQSVAKWWNVPRLQIKNHFYNHEAFITAYADLIREQLNGKNIDLLLFSYHGLPLRHIKKSHCNESCEQQNLTQNDDNRYCYRAQCYATTSFIAQQLNLSPDQYRVSFQSRLGLTPWIKPYTDLLLPQLIQQGVKNIAMVCPSFVADCLETLEEVDIRIRQQWLLLGGESFTFIPCLNDSPRWVQGLVNIIKETSE